MGREVDLLDVKGTGKHSSSMGPCPINFFAEPRPNPRGLGCTCKFNKEQVGSAANRRGMAHGNEKIAIAALARNIRQWRRLSQADVAERLLGRNQSYVSRFELDQGSLEETIAYLHELARARTRSRRTTGGQSRAGRLRKQAHALVGAGVPLALPLS